MARGRRAEAETHIARAGGDEVVIDGEVRTRRSITAAAQVLDITDRRIAKRLKSYRQDWQPESWGYYRSTPLVGFGADFIANAMSRLRFHIAWQRDVSDWPSEVDPDDPPEEMDRRVYETAVALLTRLDTGQGLMEMARKGGYGMTLPGEVVILGREEIDDATGKRTERFDAYSTSEIDLERAERGEIFVRTAPHGADRGETFKIDPATAWFFRVWRPDPEYGQLASSPMQRILEQCEEQGLLRRYMRSTYRSRLNAGLLEVPAEWHMGPEENRDEAGNKWDTLADKIVTAFSTAIDDEGSAAGVVPFIVHVPMETMGKARLISFARDFDDRVMEMRRRLDEEIASGVDLPDQVLLGLGDVKFRNAEVITSEQFKLHLEPLAIVWVKSLTAGYLQPFLVNDGVKPEVARQFSIWYDPAAVTSDPDQSASSNYGYDRGLLSARAWINANSYTEEDMPDDEELAARQEGLPWPIVKPQVPGQPPGGEAPPTQAPAPPVAPVAPVEKERPPALAAAAGGRPRAAVAKLGPRLAAAETMCRVKIQLAADQAMRRGFERVGAATRTRARDGGPQALAMVKGIDNAAIVTHLGVETVRRLGVDPQVHLDVELGKLRDRFREVVVAHQHRVVSMVASASGAQVGPLTERSAASWARAVDHAWHEFEAELQKLAHDELFLALVAAGPARRGLAAAAPAVEADARLFGEFDATVTVPAGIVRDALSIAGGTAIPDPADPGSMLGVSGGPIAADLMAEVGIGPEGFEWLYGDAATRTRPFEPHEALDGYQFTDFTDPILLNPLDFPPGPWFFPGDHAGCQCELAQQLVERGPVVEDPVSPGNLRQRGFEEAPRGEAEKAKSRNVGETFPKPNIHQAPVPEPRPYVPSGGPLATEPAVVAEPVFAAVGNGYELTIGGDTYRLEHSYRLELGKATITEEQARTVLETAAELKTQSGGVVPSFKIIDAGELTGDLRGALAYVDSQNAPREIVITRQTVNRAAEGNTWISRDPYHVMPSAQHNDALRYSIAHEYGHVTDFADPDLRGIDFSKSIAEQDQQLLVRVVEHIERKKALFENPDVHAALSQYGRSNPYEGYAESFAEWQLTAGRTTNLAAQTYAEVFGWQV